MVNEAGITRGEVVFVVRQLNVTLEVMAYILFYPRRTCLMLIRVFADVASNCVFLSFFWILNLKVRI